MRLAPKDICLYDSVSKSASTLFPVGSVAEWSKALVLGTSLFGGVGSNPTAAKNFSRTHVARSFSIACKRHSHFPRAATLVQNVQ